MATSLTTRPDQPIQAADDNRVAVANVPLNQIIQAARQTVPQEQIDVVAALVGLTKKEMASVLGVSERNLYNKPQRSLSVADSERLLLLEGLFQHGLAIFNGRRDAFAGWLRTPKSELAVPATGFPILANHYVKPTLNELLQDNPQDLSAIAQAHREVHSYSQSAGNSTANPYPTPLSLLDTTTGILLVEEVLSRIDAGVFV